MKNGWLPKQDWQKIQRSVPIPCVDVLPVRKGADGPNEIGLIYRETPHQGRRWCLIGGRLLLNESLRTAIIRQVQEALGLAVQCDLNTTIQPLFVAEYFSQQQAGALFDPRQHAIGLTFPVQIRGMIKASGEALDFRWFDPEQLPKQEFFGFGQDKVVIECIRRLNL